MSTVRFPVTNQVPILGQPFTFRAWWPEALVNCVCPSKHAIHVAGIGNPAFCPDCGKGVVIAGVAQAPSGEVGVQLAAVLKREAQTS